MYASAQFLDLLAGTKNISSPPRKRSMSSSGVSGWHYVIFSLFFFAFHEKSRTCTSSAALYLTMFDNTSMFEQLEKINSRPEPFEFYTACDLWTDKYTSGQMLKFHLDEKIDASSRNIAFIDRSIDWIVSHFNIKAGKKIADFGCGPGLYASRLARSRPS
ncbi:MAG: hypothetical protein ABFD50_13225 [Smithella sp.]